MVIVEGGEPLMKLPFWVTFTLTVIVAVGAGFAVSVNVAFAPSVTGEVPDVMVTDGVPGGGIVVVVDGDGCGGWVAYFIACSAQQFYAYLAIFFIYLIIFSIDC